MGEVYLARHIRLDRPVALKVIRNNRQEDPESYFHFLKEMNHAGKIDHPNLVKAYDAWESKGFLYLVFELLEGRTLQSIYGEEGKQTLENLVRECLEICSGLESLHKNNLIHRDIKPSNVLRLKDGGIKLIDFGLTIDANQTNALVNPGAGSKGFVSPEQREGTTTLDHRADIYSFGCLIQFMLGGLTPENNRGSKCITKQKLESIAQKMTRNLPGERYQTAAEVRKDLESAYSLLGIQKQGRGVPLATIATVGILAAAILFLFSYWFFKEKQETLNTVSGNKNTKRIPMRLQTIPAGTFRMGGSEGDFDSKPDEFPTRIISFEKPFQIGVTEVTVEQFREFVESTGYKTEAELSERGGWKSKDTSSWGIQGRDILWSSPGYNLGPDLPVTVVTYSDAVAFCEWISTRDGKKYRLPTEAEWEYACRAGNDYPFSFPINLRDSFAWSYANIKQYSTPRPVGTRQPNNWGLFDTIGNVREWCLDWYSPNAYQTLYSEAPMGPPNGTSRVIRGGSFMDKNPFLRSSNRGFLAPEMPVNNQGFRVLVEAQ